MCLTPPAPSAFPFDRLPNDLKTEILILDALVVERSPTYRQSMRTRALKLGTVCSEWREIVQSLPQLWSTIYINCSHYHYNEEVFIMYIKYSNTYPLDISITFGGQKEWQLEQGSQISSSLLKQAHRLKFLHISFGNLWHREVDWNDIHRNTQRLLLKAELPLLEMVELTQDSSINPLRYNCGIDMNNMFDDCPRLRELSITSLNHDSPEALARCTTVTNLTLTNVFVEFCINAITNLPNLTHATFKNMFYPEDRTLPQSFHFYRDSELESSLFVHDSLKSLELLVHNENIDILFLRSISCPALTRLFIRNWGSEDEEGILQAAAHFLRVSNCLLKTLQLQMDRLSSGVWPLFDCVHTTVEILLLSTNSVVCDLIPVLVERLSAPCYFPQLEQLEIFPLCGPLDYTFIIVKLQQRVDLWPSGTKIRPSIFKVVLDYMVPPTAESDEDDDYSSIVSEVVDDKTINGYRELKESGMDVSFFVHPRRYQPHPIIQKYNFE